MKIKRISKSSLIIIVVIILLLLLGVTIGLYYLLNEKQEVYEHLIYNEFEMIGGKISNDKYYLLGASNDVTFEVEKDKDFSYQITDDEGNKIDSQLIDGSVSKIKGPATLYKEGKTYHLKIENGKFKNEKYKDIKEIIFKINRPAKQQFSLNENIIKKDIKDVEVNNNYLKTNGDYKENDIIVIYDKEKLISAYKIIKKENDNYTYSIPKINEVFDDIDYYGKERINLADYQNDKDINLLLTSFIKTVYAKEDVTINKPIWHKKDGTLEIGITINTSNKKEFLANHDAKVEFTLVLAIDLYKDITLTHQNYLTVMNYDIKVKNNLNYVNDNYTKLYDTIKLKDNIENYDTKWLEENYSDLKSDTKSINKSLGKITVNTEVPGLYLDIDLGTIIDINSKGYINNLLTGKNTFVIGINDQNELYSDYKFDNKVDLNFIGDEDNKFADIINTKLSFMNIFEMNTKMISGLYTSGKSTIKVNNEDKRQTKIDYDVTGDSGFYATYLVSVNNDQEKVIYNDKNQLMKYEKKVKISSKVKEEEKKEEEKPKYKYTADQIKEMLQDGYDKLSEVEAWEEPMGTLTTMVISQKTINTDNNTFTGTWTYDDNKSYTCTYNYVTNNMSCENFTEAQNYVKATCDNMRNDYLNYLETGEIENEDAKEWENLYSDMNSCYFEAIPSNEPTDFKEDIQKILDEKELTFDDLEVLKD